MQGGVFHPSSNYTVTSLAKLNWAVKDGPSLLGRDLVSKARIDNCEEGSSGYWVFLSLFLLSPPSSFMTEMIL